MKFFIINSFRTMVYVAYIAIILSGIGTGLYNAYEETGGTDEVGFAGVIFALEGVAAQVVDVVVFTVAGWISASLVCGLIVTLLDIRDDINDRLPDARRDD
ncbi:hypothetical protein [Henriciella sp.]|uniref:hypothetical protein n=1 Tax=Henriciella sp. TaxID=1968823 RepID=UPI00261452D0|nr:hypothetical protein [Henriciella sp.]